MIIQYDVTNAGNRAGIFLQNRSNSLTPATSAII
jgi:hypothetical protein